MIDTMTKAMPDYNVYRERVLNVIEPNIRFTPDEIAFKTKIPLIHIKTIIVQLAACYRASVSVGDGGTLHYCFAQKERIYTYRTRDMLRKLFQTILWGIRGFSRMLLGSLILFYMFFYLLVLLFLRPFTAFIDEKGVSTGLERYTSLKRIWVDMEHMMIYLLTFRGFGDQVEEPRFFRSVFNFLFGERNHKKRVYPEDNIIQFIRREGWITVGDGINLTGKSEYEVGQLLLGITAKYEGDIEVSDEGVIYYYFEEIKRIEERKYRYIWGDKDALPVINPNSEEENMEVLSLMLINIVCSGLFYFGEMIHPGMAYYHLFHTILGYYPLIGGAIMIIIPLLRIPYLLWKGKRIKEQNYFSFLLNEFAYRVEQTNFPADQVEAKMQHLIWSGYPHIFPADYYEDQYIINLEKYHKMIKFSSRGNPEKIGIYDPDDVDFMHFEQERSFF